MSVRTTFRLAPTLRCFASCAGLAILLNGCQEQGRVLNAEVSEDELGSGFEDSAQRFGVRPGLRKVLFSMVDAIEDRDVARYSEHFDADQFRFVFDPLDAEEYGFPSVWDWGAERTSALNMFADDMVQSIEVDLVLGSVQMPLPSDGVPMNWRKIEALEVAVELVTEDPEGGESVIYKVVGGRATFFLESHPGVSLWRRPPLITEWRDHRIGKFQPTEYTTWGWIKSQYR